MAREKQYNVNDLINYDTHYTGPYKWQAEAPITAVRMNTLEAGVAEALLTAEESSEDVSEMQQIVNGIDSRMSDTARVANSASTTAQDALDATVEGTRAWAQVGALLISHGGVRAADGSITGQNLDNVIQSIESTLRQQTQEIGTARGAQLTLNDRLSAIDNPNENSNSMLANLNQAKTTIQLLINELHPNEGNDSSQWTSLTTKLNNIIARFTPVESEVAEAHRANKTNDTLNARLNDIDSRESPNSLISRVDALDGGDNPLSGRVTALENELLGTGNGLTATTRLDQVYNEVALAHRDDIVGGDSLQARFNDLDNTISHPVDLQNNDNGGLTERITSLESAASSMQTGLDTADGRLDSIDSALDTIGARLDDIDGQEGDIAGLNTRITSIETSLANDRLDNIDSAISDIQEEISDAHGSYNSLDARLDNIEQSINNSSSGGSNTEVIDNATFTQDGTPILPNSATPDPTIDYLIRDTSNKYYYWKYINNTWELISGGVEAGSSSGVILTQLPAVAEGDPNIDYFIGSNENGYIHYRFIEAGENEQAGHYIQILPKGLIDYIGINTYGNPVAYTREDHENNLLGSFYALKGVTYTPNYDPNDANTLVSQTLQFTRTDGETIDPIVIVGGGGGSGSVYTIRIETTTDIARTFTANDTTPVTITAKVVMKQGADLINGATATGYIQYRIAGATDWNTGDRIEVVADTEALKYTIKNDTYFTVDVTKYLQVDKTVQIRLAIEAHPESEEDTVMRYQTFSVSKVNISIADEEFDYASVKNSNFQFNYRCFGSGISKTVHFLLDGEDIVTPVSTSTHNVILQQVIPMTNKANGMHTFQVYFVTNTGLESNRLNYYILYNTDTTRQAPLIGAAAENTSIVDGDELLIKYSVATGSLETTDKIDIELYTMDNGNKTIIQTAELTDVANNVQQIWRTFNYPKVIQEIPNVIPDPITVYVKLTATHTVVINEVETDLTDSQIITVSINYLNTTYNLEPEGTNNLLYEYIAYGRTNNDSDKETYIYDYTNVSGQNIRFTGSLNDFNWATDGYVDGKCLTIGGGATYSINVPIFSSTFNNINLEENAEVADITQIGRTIEIDYEVQSATDLNAVIIDCMTNVSTTTENGITTTRANGFRVTPQSCYLLNSSAGIEQDESGFILNEDSIAAAYLTPGQRIHLVFVIEPWATDAMRDNSFDGEYHQSTNIYVNGEFANTCPYNRDKVTGNLAGNNFSTNATITIGSDTCLIKLYSVKLYNRGLTQAQVLQNYKVSPIATRDKLVRLEENDILNGAGLVDYEKARTKYTCLLLTGPAPTDANNAVVPTISPFKGSPSPAGRRDKKTNEIVGKTESGLTLTKPSKTEAVGYTVEFDLRDKIPTDQNIDVPAYMGARGAYCSSNNVQGTSSQKYPVHNLKVYLAKWQGPKTTTTNVALEPGEEVPEGTETVEIDGITYKVVTETSPAEIKKVKYSLKGKDEHGDALGTEESTLCWKADYMSTDHANTFNANIADGLFNNRAEDGWPITDWAKKHYQNTVYGIRCLLFQKQGDNPPEFIGDGCLNNDKGNSKTYGLEAGDDDGNDTRSQKWEFTNNSEDLGYFKTDDLMAPMGDSIRAKNGFESCYPDEGDLKDDNLEPNYTHLQILLTWLSKRANYWDESDPTAKEAKKAIFKSEFTKHFNLSHVLTYYIFSQYIALCDNRVKNMFLRSDNVREEIIRNSSHQIMLEGNTFPEEDPSGTRWTAYVNPTTGVTTPSEVDWETGEGHSNFAIWEPVLYDLDSCFGVENVGLIKIRYDANWDYEWKGTPQFNGYNSILWLQVADSFQSEIAALAVTLYNANPGLNFRTFNQQQIIENQAQISPALTNQDMILKFDKPWSEGFINYAETPDGNGNYPRQTPLYKYLQRGSRAAQKSQFMQQRSMLLSSMYGAAEFLNSSIKFRTGVPVGASGNIIGYENNEHEIVSIQDEQHTIPVYGNGDLTETQITVKANQILYPGVAYGDNKPATRVLTNGGKVNANTACTIQATSAVQGNDGIFIYGASVLTDIGDISKFKPLQLDVSAGVNLKRLIIGSNAAGYSNNTTNSITGLNKCLLLEEINIRNLKQMSTLALTSNGFIKEVYAAGSGVGSISLPQGGVLETIEYGANITNITIINQGYLTNFSYEDSQNNHYANVTCLWIENTPNVPIADIIINRLPGLTEGVRLIDIDIDLGNDTTMLEMLASEDYAKGKHLTSSGSRNYTKYPDVTGHVKVTNIRQSLLNKLAELYPSLVINYTTAIQEFALTYKNVDAQGNETELLTLYRTSNESIPDPIESIDNITGNFDIQSAPANQIGYDGQQWVPLRASDAQYIYRFGTYNNAGKYTTYSGWRIKEDGYIRPTSTTSITKNITLVATYPDESRTLQTYNVTWYDDNNNVLLRREGIPYGTDASQYNPPSKYNTSNPLTVKKNSNGVYKVFRGWDRPVSIVKGNIDVHSLWYEFNGNFSNFASINELNPAGLYALSFVDTATRENLLNSRVGNDVKYIKLGRDFEYDSQVETYDLLNGADYHHFDGQVENVIVCDGTNYPAIYPLIDLNKDFTFALDFQFALDSTLWNRSVAEHVIASCFRSTGGSIAGFRVILAINDSQRPQIQVQWGTSSLVIDAVEVNAASDTYISHRNMIVLRHNSTNPNQLTVYYLPPSYKNSNLDPSHYNLQSTITSEPITWASSVAVSAPLILGGNFEGATNNIESTNTRLNATGTIFYAKYWGDDLGNRSCLELAAWPHETVAYKISGYDNGSNTNNQLTIGSNSTNKINFTPAQALGDRTIDHSLLNNLSFTGASDDLTCGWVNSRIRAYMNNIIYNAFPIAYQSLIEKIPITTISQTSSGTGNMATVTGEMQQTEDFLYLPAYYEVDPSLPLGSQYRYEANKPWTWLDVGNIDNVFKKESGYLVQETDINTLNYLRQYYFQKPLLSSARIFHFASNDNPYGQIFIYNDQNVSVQPGDIWYYDTMAYMYVSAEDIQKGVKIDNTKAAGNGGWAPAVVTALRTFNKDIQGVRRHPYNFMKILYNGSISTEMSYGANDTNDRALLPEFSI